MGYKDKSINHEEQLIAKFTLLIIFHPPKRTVLEPKLLSGFALNVNLISRPGFRGFFSPGSVDKGPKEGCGDG